MGSAVVGRLAWCGLVGFGCRGGARRVRCRAGGVWGCRGHLVGKAAARFVKEELYGRREHWGRLVH